MMTRRRNFNRVAANRFAMIVVALALVGCDDAETSVTPASTPTASVVIKPPRAELSTLARLRADVETHVWFTDDGTLVWMQIGIDGLSFQLFANPPGSIAGVVSPDARGVARVLKLDQGGFAAFAPMGKSLIVAVFVSADSKAMSLIEIDLAEGSTSLIADDKAIRAASGFEDNMNQPAPSLVRAGGQVWLWLTSADRQVMVRLSDQSTDLRLTKLFDTVQLDSASFDVAGPRVRLSPTAREGVVLLTEPSTRAIYQLDAAGRLTRAAALTPESGTIRPAIYDSAGRLLVFATKRKPEFAFDVGSSPEIDDKLPGFWIITTHAPVLIGQDQMDATGDLNKAQLRLDRLVADPVTSGRFVAYNMVTGELVAIQIK